MSTEYKILFIISIRHEYYANRACNDFLIRPTADCMELFATYRLLFRQAGNKAIVLAPVEKMTPVQEPDNGVNFRFYLYCENPYFINFTNFDQQDYKSQKFYASNQHNNFSGQVAYLTRTLSEYTDQADYKQGSLAVNAQKEVLECLQVNPSGPNSKPLTDKKFWRKLSGNKTQIATPDDLISFRPDLLPMVMEDGANIKLEGYNSITKDFTDTIIQHKTDLYAGRGEAIRIFSQLSARRYRLTIKGKKEIIIMIHLPMHIRPGVLWKSTIRKTCRQKCRYLIRVSCLRIKMTRPG
ncbi:MAG: hypothetical protein HC867_04755 [Bacteroidia bacterium]|nr:hypothetical protein [Bacteroidia bacterium]